MIKKSFVRAQNQNDEKKFVFINILNCILYLHKNNRH